MTATAQSALVASMRFARCPVRVVTVGVGNVERAAGDGQAAERHLDRDADGEWERDAERVAEADAEFHLRGIDVQHALPKLQPFADGFVRLNL